MKITDLLVLGAVGYGAYWLYTNWLKPSPGGAIDTAETAVANLFSGTSPTATLAANSIQFPDGSSIPISALTGQTWVGNTLTFPYNGSTWQLAPQVNGVYQATPLAGLGSYSAPALRRRKNPLQSNDDPFIRSLGAR